MEAINNPRFPHRCVIYRREDATSFNPDGETTVVYDGVCRKSGSTNIRSFNTGTASLGKVDTCDYRVSMPGIVKGIQKGDLVDITDLIGTERELRIVSYGATRLGKCQITDPDGGIKAVEGGTEILCNISSN